MADIVFHFYDDVFEWDILDILEMLNIVRSILWIVGILKILKIRRFFKNLFIYIYIKMLNWAFVIYLSNFIIKKYK